MVAQSLLVLTTGRLFCSRYVDTLPVRIVRCPVAFPPLTYYQLWHDVDACSRRRCAGCASRCATWRANSAGTACRSAAGEPAAIRRTLYTPCRVASAAAAHCAATCSTSPPTPAWGETDARARALPPRPLAADRRRRPHRRACSRARSRRRGLAAPRPRRPAGPARLHRHPRAQRRSSTSSRATAPSCSTGSSTYTFPAEARHADPAHAEAGAALFLDALLAHGTTAAVVFPTVHKVSVDALFAAARSAACAWSPARC